MRFRSALAHKAAMSLKATDCVLGYLRHLPEAGTIIRLADEEAVLVRELRPILAQLIELRAKAHQEAFGHWTEEQIRQAVDDLHEDAEALP